VRWATLQPSREEHNIKFNAGRGEVQNGEIVNACSFVTDSCPVCVSQSELILVVWDDGALTSKSKYK
jgi:hypothetical protein